MEPSPHGGQLVDEGGSGRPLLYLPQRADRRRHSLECVIRSGSRVGCLPVTSGDVTCCSAGASLGWRGQGSY